MPTTVEQQCVPAAQAAVQQQPEVAEFLRYLVGRGYRPGDQPDAMVDDDAGADGEAAHQVVQAIGEQDQVSPGLWPEIVRWQWCQWRNCSSTKNEMKPVTQK